MGLRTVRAQGQKVTAAVGTRESVKNFEMNAGIPGLARNPCGSLYNMIPVDAAGFGRTQTQRVFDGEFDPGSG